MMVIPVPASGFAAKFAVPNDPALCGLNLYVQVVEGDAGASKGLSFTAGLHLLFGL